jgi:hypothetical protein
MIKLKALTERNLPAPPMISHFFICLKKYPELTAFELYFWQSRISDKKNLNGAVGRLDR